MVFGPHFVEFTDAEAQKYEPGRFKLSWAEMIARPLFVAGSVDHFCTSGVIEMVLGPIVLSTPNVVLGVVARVG